MIEKLFEGGLWGSRFMVLMAVLFGIIGAVVLFIVASFDVYNTAKLVIHTYINHRHPALFHENVVGGIIGAVDLYLIGVVMLLFSFGLYELFISDIDAAREDKNRQTKILAIHSLDQLKDKISKVIVMVLVVSFFKKVGLTAYSSPLSLFGSFNYSNISWSLLFKQSRTLENFKGKL